MRKYIAFYLRLGAFFLMIFALHKLFFLVYNHSRYSGIGIYDLFQIFVYGLKLDLSSAGYMVALPSLITVLCGVFGTRFPDKFVRYFIYIITSILTLIAIIDMKLYTYWGEKFDFSHLLYLTDMNQMISSLHLTDVLVPVSLFFVLVFLEIQLAKVWIFPKLKKMPATNWKVSLVYLVFGFCSVFVIRGGFSLVPLVLGIPLNVGAVYFHTNLNVNHAAVNPFWNFMFSITELSKLNNTVDFLPEKEVNKLMDEINPHATGKFKKLLNTEKPNVLLLVLEGFTSKGIGAFGADFDVTPNLSKLAKEGIRFTNFYANGHRSNRGIPSIYSSYPGLPQTSIILFPDKVEKLPHVMGEFKEEGYKTAFYYGGEIDFANMRSYFLQAKTDKIVSKLDFSFKDNNSKWGVHDHIVFNRMLEDLNKEKEPFFYSIFTLSSHEPFDIPDDVRITSEEDNNHKFMNAMYYTDRSLAHFISEAKKQSWWENTLVIITADHGVNYINSTENADKITFEIPMLWLGGALAVKDTAITKMASQVDIAPTLLAQVGMDASKFQFGRNILASDFKPRAFYCFGDGGTYMDPTHYLSYDIPAKTRLYSKGYTKNEKYDLVYLQYLINDFHSK